MIIILDAGHGENTLGKRSPDGKLREYKYCREIMQRVKSGLEKLGYTVFTTIDTDYDVPLSTRVKTINRYCDKYGTSNIISVSIHCDAKGSGSKWENARGWSVRVALKHSLNTQKLAWSLYNLGDEFENLWDFYKSWGINAKDTLLPSVNVQNMTKWINNIYNTLTDSNVKGFDEMINVLEHVMKKEFKKLVKFYNETMDKKVVIKDK